MLGLPLGSVPLGGAYIAPSGGASSSMSFGVSGVVAFGATVQAAAAVGLPVAAGLAHSTVAQALAEIAAIAIAGEGQNSVNGVAAAFLSAAQAGENWTERVNAIVSEALSSGADLTLAAAATEGVIRAAISLDARGALEFQQAAQTYSAAAFGARAGVGFIGAREGAPQYLTAGAVVVSAAILAAAEINPAARGMRKIKSH